jgi:hypothetical protein
MAYPFCFLFPLEGTLYFPLSHEVWFKLVVNVDQEDVNKVNLAIVTTLNQTLD